jgi:hypothetical protein
MCVFSLVWFSLENTYLLISDLLTEVLEHEPEYAKVSKETYEGAKETYYCVKRDLLQCQKRPTF